ncbi:MAG: 3-hydroxyanthranilate 3,4-dioxygenase, partial [Phycisphaerae bacterium]
MKPEPSLNLMNWIEKNRGDLKPPVGNKYLYDGEDFFVMIVGGPNARNDFHVTNSEEFFYQIKGDVIVRTIENGRIKDNPIREGETFFIPGGVPHAPTRPPGTLGLVVERRRPPGEMEHL